MKFFAKNIRRVIEISSAIINEPSSQISGIRTLICLNFQDVYPLYLRRENGEKVSREVTKITVNQVYYFSLIKHLVYSNKDVY